MDLVYSNKLFRQMCRHVYFSRCTIPLWNCAKKYCSAFDEKVCKNEKASLKRKPSPIKTPQDLAQLRTKKMHPRPRKMMDTFFYGRILNSGKVVNIQQNKNETNFIHFDSSDTSKSSAHASINKDYEKFAKIYSENYVGYKTKFSKTINNNISQCYSSISSKKKTLLELENKCYDNEDSECITKDNKIEIDNSKYTDVPQTIDLNALSNYPLFKSVNCVKQLYTKSEASNSILSRTTNDTCSSITSSKGIISIAYNGPEHMSLPSVGKILSETMSEESRAALQKWETKMIAKLGVQGFFDYKKGTKFI